MLYEVKVYTPFRVSGNSLGRGSRGCGGAPSTTEGYHLAFGNTEEDLLLTILGCKQRGLPSQPPLDHTTGYGYVAQHTGHYSDGLAKGNQVVPFISETFGGINASALRLLTRLHAAASPENARDGTYYIYYGTARCATSSFHAHHLRLISLAAQRENIALILAGADVAKTCDAPLSLPPSPADLTALKRLPAPWVCVDAETGGV